MPDINDGLRQHTQDGSLICGGDDEWENHYQSCSKWNSDSGLWNWKFVTLPRIRQSHVSWTPQSGVGTYLMGGNKDPWKTNLVMPNGTVELYGFDLHEKYKYHQTFHICFFIHKSFFEIGMLSCYS